MATNILDNIYDVIFHPDKGFEKLKEEKPLLQGFIIVICISLITHTLNFTEITNKESIIWFATGLIGSVYSWIISWLILASFIEIIASVFNQGGKTKEFLTLSGFALLPWMFIYSINLFKQAGEFGILFSIILGLIVWLWSIILIIMAMMKVYNLSIGKILVLSVIPFIGGFIGLSIIIGFFSTLMQLLKT